MDKVYKIHVTIATKENGELQPISILNMNKLNLLP